MNFDYANKKDENIHPSKCIKFTKRAKTRISKIKTFYCDMRYEDFLR